MILHHWARALHGALAAFALAVSVPSGAALLPQDALYALWANDVVVDDSGSVGSGATIAEGSGPLHISQPPRIRLDASCSGDIFPGTFAGPVWLPLNSFQALGALRLDSYELFDDGTHHSTAIDRNSVAQCMSVDGSEAAQRILTNEETTGRHRQRPSPDPLRVEMAQVDAVPEPAISAMLTVGAAALGLRLSRRRARR